MTYKIKKAPAILMGLKNSRPIKFPIERLKVGQMFEAKSSEKMSIYNAIKHRRNYTEECKGWVFRVVTISKDKVACIRTK